MLPPPHPTPPSASQLVFEMITFTWTSLINLSASPGSEAGTHLNFSFFRCPPGTARWCVWANGGKQKGRKGSTKVRGKRCEEEGTLKCRWIADKSCPRRVVLKRRSHGIATKRERDWGKRNALQTQKRSSQIPLERHPAWLWARFSAVILAAKMGGWKERFLLSVRLSLRSLYRTVNEWAWLHGAVHFWEDACGAALIPLGPKRLLSCSPSCNRRAQCEDTW